MCQYDMGRNKNRIAFFNAIIKDVYQALEAL